VPRFVFDPPDRFVAGTVGEPGQRTFYLQASQGQRVTSVALEKQQVAALAQGIDELCDEVVRRSGGLTQVPAVAPPELVDRAPLTAPVLEEFRAARLSLAWDPDDERVVIEAAPAVEPDSDEDTDDTDDAADAGTTGGQRPDLDDPMLDVLVVRISGALARAFAARAHAVVRAGRPPCPFCNLPLDPSGHVCPRQNGYRRR